MALRVACEHCRAFSKESSRIGSDEPYLLGRFTKPIIGVFLGNTRAINLFENSSGPQMVPSFTRSENTMFIILVSSHPVQWRNLRNKHQAHNLNSMSFLSDVHVYGIISSSFSSPGVASSREHCQDLSPGRSSSRKTREAFGKVIENRVVCERDGHYAADDKEEK
ncbi:hypothetical protein An07g02460 [Aspergillus niger]|uniref:Uncharacterized protein n=2 Tax=Aspergillus niger TaxID=5061 RepID=A2QMK7_ASPNC|nr:hypothetical protein An07g02460 [Aspergillus niger]CAK39335.1 hypothetical protein An07g02460 [Aspergillus niger]